MVVVVVDIVVVVVIDDDLVVRLMSGSMVEMLKSLFFYLHVDHHGIVEVTMKKLLMIEVAYLVLDYLKNCECPNLLVVTIYSVADVEAVVVVELVEWVVKLRKTRMILEVI